MKIRKMNIRDIAGVSDIELQSFGSTDKDNIEKSLKNENYTYLVADIDGLVVGYICFFTTPDFCDIISLAVDRMHRQRGLGKILSEHMLKIIESKNIKEVSLEVRESNTIAISLYTKLGFVKHSIRKKYYEGIEDAIIMKYEFAK